MKILWSVWWASRAPKELIVPCLFCRFSSNKLRKFMRNAVSVPVSTHWPTGFDTESWVRKDWHSGAYPCEERRVDLGRRELVADMFHRPDCGNFITEVSVSSTWPLRKRPYAHCHVAESRGLLVQGWLEAKMVPWQEWKVDTLCDLYETLTITQAIIYCSSLAISFHIMNLLYCLFS